MALRSHYNSPGIGMRLPAMGARASGLFTVLYRTATTSMDRKDSALCPWPLYGLMAQWRSQPRHTPSRGLTLFNTSKKLEERLKYSTISAKGARHMSHP